MGAQWPLVVDRLAALLPTLPGWADVGVFDGAAYDSVPAVFVTVGHSTDGVSTTGGNFTTTQAPDGYRRQESGQVVCQMTFAEDVGTLADARAVVFPLLDALDTYVRSDRRLGVLSQEGTSDLSFDVNSTQAIPGAALTVLFTLTYFTVT